MYPHTLTHTYPHTKHTQAAGRGPPSSALPGPPRGEPAKPIVYPNKEAAKEAFKALLQDYDVPPEASWDNTMRLIIHDARYGALKALGEKKAAFNEYCTVRGFSRGFGA